MTTPELTLENIRKSPRLNEPPKVTYRVSDFRTKEQRDAQRELRAQRKKRKKAQQKFNAVDAKVAEIMARFGYEVYEKWDNQEIDDEKMERLLAAERAREKAYILPLEGIVACLVKDCIKRSKKEQQPKGPKSAAKILNSEIRIAKGE